MKKIISLLLSAAILLSVFTSGTAYAATTKEKESNDSIAMANTLQLNTNMSGVIDNDDDTDYYKFTLLNAGKITVNFSIQPKNTECEWVVCLLDVEQGNADEHEIDYKIFEEKNGTGEMTSIGLAKGTYYLKIFSRWHLNSTKSPYVLTVNYQQSDFWEKESNNIQSFASLIQLNTKMYGTSINYDDDDYFKFTLPSAGIVTIEFSIAGKKSSAEWRVGIYNDKKEYNTMNIYEKDGTVTFSPLGLSEGTYYIYIDPNYSFSTNPYGLTVNYQQRNDWEKESNDVKDEANMLTLNTKMNGVITDEEDDDYYKFILPSSGKVKIAFSINGKKTGKEWQVELLDGNRNSISKMNIVEDNGLNSMISPTLRKGTYYLVVSSYYRWNYSTSVYKLSVSPVITVNTPSGFKVAKRYSKKVKLTWKSVSNANGYQIQYSTKKSFKGAKTVNVKGAKKTSYTVKKLKAKKKYYVRVQAYKKVGTKYYFSGWSNIRSVKTKK